MSEPGEVQQPAVGIVANQQSFDKAVETLGDAAVKIADRYFSHLETKGEVEADVEKAQIKNQHLLNTWSICLLGFIVLVATVVILYIKEIPPALNSILCFVAGYAASGIRGFVIQKGNTGHSAKE